MAAKLQQYADKFLAFAKPRLQLFMYYAKTELSPPTPLDMPVIVKGTQNIITGAATFRWRNMTVREAFRNALITTEVVCWFFVGECIGKRHVIGYILTK